jgi:predicted ATPase
LEQGIALYDPRKHSPLVYDAVLHLASLSFASRALWHLGYPDRALKRSQEAVVLAQELSDPYSLAFALNMAAWLHQFRRERQAVQDRAEVMLALSSEQGFARSLVLGTLWRDSVLAEQGQGEEGVARLRQDLVAYRATGSEIYRPYWLALLAEAYGQVGRAEEGLTALAEALAVVDKTGERWYEAELYRLKGELTLQEASQKSKVKGQKSKIETIPQPLTPSTQAETEAEVCFLKAIEVAQKQQAKSLELRATVSLARLWQRQGKKEDAHQMLADIYGWFTEGLDTKDLQEAKALLNELT